MKRLLEEIIFELMRADDGGERGLGRSEGGMSVTEITEDKGPETVVQMVKGWIKVAHGGANSRRTLPTMVRVLAAGTHWC